MRFSSFAGFGNSSVAHVVIRCKTALVDSNGLNAKAKALEMESIGFYWKAVAVLKINFLGAKLFHNR